MFSACSEFKLKCVGWSCETLKFDILNFVFMTIFYSILRKEGPTKVKDFATSHRQKESNGLYEQKNYFGCDTSKCWLTSHSHEVLALSGLSCQQKAILLADFASSDEGPAMSGSSS